MGEQPFDPSVLNIMSMAGVNEGDNIDFEEVHGHDGDDDRPTNIHHSMMTNTRPRVQQVSRLNPTG